MEFFLKILNSQIFFVLEALHYLVSCILIESDCPSEMADCPSEMADTEGWRKRPKHRNQKAMDFDPVKSTLHNQVEVEKYLLKYGVRLPSNIWVDWCPPNTDYTNALKVGGMYLHPQFVALGLSFPRTGFLCDIFVITKWCLPSWWGG